ncbi:MAG: DUF4838 domain-containing protein [Candidatus Pacebacteria bacterium]|nr:DUF4838 domain-containing protein [Candidatus Paceibacterota bacterium]
MRLLTSFSIVCSCCFICLLTGCTSVATGLRPREVTLAREAQPAATILLAENPTRAARLGAYELQYHLKLITGAELQIVTSRDAVEGLAICIGDSIAAREYGCPLPDKWKFLEYAILFKRDAIILAGHDQNDHGKVDYDSTIGLASRYSLPPIMDPQGTLHAVYSFLEDYCGVRWWNATESGTEFTRSPTLTVTARNVRRQPSFLYRDWTGARWGWPNVFSQCFWNDRTPEFEAFIETAYPAAYAYHLKADKPQDPDRKKRGRFFFENHKLWFRIHQTEGIWLRRMRLGGSLRYKSNHSMKPYVSRFWGDGENAHQEWFAKGFDGTPNQLCYTNEDVVAQVAQDARDYFDSTLNNDMIRAFNAIPNSDYFPVVPNDGWGFCKCPECEALMNPDEKDSPHFANGWLSDYWFNFVNKVAREVKKTHPDKYIATLSYAGYAKTPSFPLEDTIAVQVCMGVRHPTDHPTQGHEWNILRNWLDKLPGDQVFLWLYYTFPRESAGDGRHWHCFPGFFMHHIGAIFKEYERLGCQGPFFNGWGEDINTYITLKMLNDTTLSVDDILTDFYTDYYGAAAPPMRKLYSMMEDLFSNPDYYPPGRRGQNPDVAWGFLGTHERMETMRGLLQQAREMAVTDQQRKRIDIFDAGIFSYMEEGRQKYEKQNRAVTGRRYARAPWTFQPVSGNDPTNVNWQTAFALVNWRRPYGEPTLHLPLIRLAHDGTNLYIRYDEFARPRTKHQPGTPESVRLQLATIPAGGAVPHFISVAPDGTFDTWKLAGEGAKERWESHWMVRSSLHPGETWTVELAIPLADLNVEPGKRLFFNAVRKGDPSGDVAIWQCTQGPIQKPEHMGFLYIDGPDHRPPADVDADILGELQMKDLTGWWRFEEDSGEIAVDSSGHDLDGVIAGMDSGHVRRGRGVHGEALYCGGGSRYKVQVPSAGPLRITEGPLSVEAWVHIDPNLLGNGYPLVISTGAFNIHLRRNATRIWFQLNGADGKPHRVNTQDFPRAANSIAPKQWTQLVGVWDSETIRFYMNGRPHGEPVPFEGPLISSDAPLRIGGSSPVMGVDEVAIYKRAFTPAEVQARFLRGCAALNAANRRK